MPGKKTEMVQAGLRSRGEHRRSRGRPQSRRRRERAASRVVCASAAGPPKRARASQSVNAATATIEEATQPESHANSAVTIARTVACVGAHVENVLDGCGIHMCNHMLNAILLTLRSECATENDACTLTLAVLRWGSARLPSPGPNVYCCTTAVTTLGRAGDVDSAEWVFNDMLERGVQPNVKAYTALIWAFASAGRCNDALDLREVMHERGIQPNERTYNALISCCARARRHREAWQLLHHMHSVGLMPNVHCLVSLVDACAKAGDSAGASAAFEKIESSGFSLNPHAVAALAKAYTISRDAASLRHMLLRIQSNELPADTPAMNALLDGFAETGKASLAAQAFGEMRWRGLTQDAISFNCLMRALLKKNKCADALAAWDFMYKQGIECNANTLSVVLGACLRVGRGEEAERAYILMVHEQGVEPDQLTRAQLVAAMCTQGRPEDALREAWETKSTFDTRSRERIVRALVDADSLDGAMRVLTWAPAHTSLSVLSWVGSKLCAEARQREVVDVLLGIIPSAVPSVCGEGEPAEDARTDTAASLVAEIAGTGDAQCIAHAFAKLRELGMSITPPTANRVRELLLQNV